MSLAIGLNPVFSRPATGPDSGAFLLSYDAAWWLLETVLLLGLMGSGAKPLRASVRAWVCLVWLFASAARFTPLLLTATSR
ncbi:hypothetical protein FraEuI1c_1492 [Pseudofrankia inefficax]|uniref:Uncharacterized protein n=1 Tax=Pseudofrankia inefficax (strain DSM 45817 / CECT 9037 / DDB 130130 / EuI1c) TaxID=298654 RepID=E3J6C7_PSEI1|nr:hypothetical protein FraEuI1c_1492 [Pseudofrankia inefficax]